MTGLDLAIRPRPKIVSLRQAEVAECGLVCLAMLAQFHGYDADLRALRRRFNTSLRGESLSGLLSIADEIGLGVHRRQIRVGELPEIRTPAILHLKGSHLVVVEKIGRKRAYIHDPGAGAAWLPLDELTDRFSGLAIEVYPRKEFTQATKTERLKFTSFVGQVVGLKRAITQILILSAVLQLYVLVSPYFLQAAIDIALPALDLDLLTVVAAGFALFVLINAGAGFLRSFVIAACGSSLGFYLSTKIGRHLLRLPVDWFERRHVGNILGRLQSVKPIQDALVSGGVSAVIDGIMTIFTLIVMAFYSFRLTLLALAAFALYAGLRFVSLAAQRRREEEAIDAAALVQSAMIENLRGITVLRTLNQEGSRHAVWSERLGKSVNAQFQVARISVWMATANSLIFGLETVLSVWLAIALVMEGGFSVGMIFAFLSYKTQFLTRSASLIDQLATIRMVGLHLDRLADIALAEEDMCFSRANATERRFEGGIELRNVIYRYGGKSAPAVLDALSLKVEPGEHIAITGPSASGKSTLVKVLLGLVQPESGEVLIDGHPLSIFGFTSFRSQVASVLQDDTLFAGTIADNISFFDDFTNLERVIQSARIACIHDEVMRMPMGYDSVVGDMGASLSGGQRQRVLLARALYRRPRLLIMDEGTSHLDSANEAAINKAISAMGITRIVVAHRAETIASAKKVYVMSEGRLLGPL